MGARTEADDARVAAELRTHADTDEVHDLPGVHHLWTDRFIVPLFRKVGVSGIDQLSCEQVRAHLQSCAARAARVVSLGCIGEAELPLGARLANEGIINLALVLLELNPDVGQFGHRTSCACCCSI